MKRPIGMMAGIAMTFVIAAPALAQPIQVWWTKPDYQQEEEQVEAIAKAFTEETGIEVTLSFLGSSDLNTKTPAAVEVGNPPEVAFGGQFDAIASPKWAYDDQLVDLSDVIAGREDEFYEPALVGATFYNNATGERSLHAFPLGVNIRNINYNLKILKEAGFSPSDIPDEWEPFWNFWCDEVQPAARDAGYRVNAVGQGMSGVANGSDIYFPFLVELAAYGVHWIDEDGKLLVDDPDVRSGFITALDHFTGLYKRDCVPDSVTTWDNSDNNTYFHNESVILTSVASPSIVNRYLDDGEDEVYYDETRTMGYPNGVDGKPIAMPSQNRQVVVFKKSANPEAGKEFVKFFSRLDNMQAYNDASFGQVFPSMKAVGDSDFWTNEKDPHHYAVYQHFQKTNNAGRVERFPNHHNYKLSAANAENIWGRAMGRVIVDGWAPEKAVDELFARLKELVGQ